MNVLFVSSEVVPYSKTGGLADVSGSLPPAIAALGHAVRVVTPKYKKLNKVADDLGLDVTVTLEGLNRTTRLFEGKIVGEAGEFVPVTLLAQSEFFDRDEIYSTPGGDYPDNDARFAFFCKAALEAARALDFKPDIIHLNDWQSALVAVYVRANMRDDPFFSGARIVLTVHNLGYQGLFSGETLKKADIEESLFTPQCLEFFGRVNYLKGGMIFADAVTAVSEGYAREIMTEEQGMGLDGVLRERAGRVHGIINGVDYSEWNPKRDKYIVTNYTPKKLIGKEACKKDLQNAFRLPALPDVPLIGMISRLAEQKGFDLIEEAMPDLMIRDLQLVILGTGEEKYHKYFESVKSKYKNKLGVKLAYDNTLAHKIEAGADMFLMPSLYEPCGLNQMYSLKYGTVPIVRATGGLDDTVIEDAGGEGAGFKFRDYTTADMLACIDRALKTYMDRKAWKKIMTNGMAKDYSWKQSAEKYVILYQSLFGE